MPKFELNDNSVAAEYDALSDFCKTYVEAMFFTNDFANGDPENEFKMNELGVRRLPRESIRAIKRDCDKFLALEVDGKTVQQWIDESELDSECTGTPAHDFWYSRQGHGCGFWDGDYSDVIGEALDKAAKQMGECYGEIARGWIYVH